MTTTMMIAVTSIVFAIILLLLLHVTMLRLLPLSSSSYVHLLSVGRIASPLFGERRGERSPLAIAAALPVVQTAMGISTCFRPCLCSNEATVRQSQYYSPPPTPHPTHRENTNIVVCSSHRIGKLSSINHDFSTFMTERERKRGRGGMSSVSTTCSTQILAWARVGRAGAGGRQRKRGKIYDIFLHGFPTPTSHARSNPTVQPTRRQGMGQLPTLVLPNPKQHEDCTVIPGDGALDSWTSGGP